MNGTLTSTTTGTLDKALLGTGLMTVSQVCRAIPGARGNVSVNPSTVTRWITGGCPARTGERIKLKATRCGSRWLVAPADLAEFFEALGSTVPSTTASQKPRTETQRRAACILAIKDLEHRGA